MVEVHGRGHGQEHGRGHGQGWDGLNDGQTELDCQYKRREWELGRRVWGRAHGRLLGPRRELVHGRGRVDDREQVHGKVQVRGMELVHGRGQVHGRELEHVGSMELGGGLGVTDSPLQSHSGRCSRGRRCQGTH